MDYFRRQARTLPLLVGIAILIPLTYITGYVYGYGDCHALLYGKPGQFMQAMNAGDQGSWFAPGKASGQIDGSKQVHRPALVHPASVSLSDPESVENAM